MTAATQFKNKVQVKFGRQMEVNMNLFVVEFSEKLLVLCGIGTECVLPLRNLRKTKDAV